MAQDMKAKRNLPVRRPSNDPPGLMGLATPYLRHLARPSEADKIEVVYVRKKKREDLKIMFSQLV